MKAIFSAVLAMFAFFGAFRTTWENAVAGQEGQKNTMKFRMEELPEKLTIGYAVLLVDVNGDGKKDIVAVDTTRVIWLENPSWKVHTVIKGMTKADNVCIDAHDIDGDGQLDFAVGAGWKNLSTKEPGTLQWLKRGKSLDEPWALYPIDLEPTIHRIRFADIDGNGKPALISVPLLGRNSTAANNWTDGMPIRVTAYRIPKDPTKDRWTPEVLDESLHVAHNFHPIPAAGRKGEDILMASYEGVNLLSLADGKWKKTHLGEGNQDTPKAKRGASEIKMGKLKNGKKLIATIEPWHGDQVVVYTEPSEKGKLWTRNVIDEQLRWGHAVAFADLDGDGSDELVIGVRDNPGKTDKFTEKCGVRVYRATVDAGSKWQRQIIDNGGVAVEDLRVADLNGDGKMDIVAVGRATKNIRVYWNETK